jgi:hypothetical protein
MFVPRKEKDSAHKSVGEESHLVCLEKGVDTFLRHLKSRTGNFFQGRLKYKCYI